MLLKILRRRKPKWGWPAASTAGDILKRHGLVKPRRRRQHPQHPGRVQVEVQSPNDLWSTDFKGEFRTGDRRYCYPLTVADRCSRYLLGCEGKLSTAHVGARPVFEQLLCEYGLPLRLEKCWGTFPQPSHRTLVPGCTAAALRRLTTPLHKP